MILSINISNSNNLNKFLVGIFTRKFTKQEWVSEWVSQLVTDKHNQWSDSGPIKKGVKSPYEVFYNVQDVGE